MSTSIPSRPVCLTATSTLLDLTHCHKTPPTSIATSSGTGPDFTPVGVNYTSLCWTMEINNIGVDLVREKIVHRFCKSKENNSGRKPLPNDWWFQILIMEPHLMQYLVSSNTKEIVPNVHINFHTSETLYDHSFHQQFWSHYRNKYKILQTQFWPIKQ